MEKFNILMGTNIPDVACGMHLMRTQKVKEFLFHRHGFEVGQEIAAQMLVDGWVAFVPINYRRRIDEAKAPTWRQGFRALFATFGIARWYNPVVLFGLVAGLALVPAVVLLLYSIVLYHLHGLFNDNAILASLILFVSGGPRAHSGHSRIHAQKNGMKDDKLPQCLRWGICSTCASPCLKTGTSGSGQRI